MPMYVLRCDDCGHQEEVVTSIAGRPSPDMPIVCPSCSELSFWRDFQAEAPVHGKAFQPYVEYNLANRPVEITGPEQRDRLLDKHGVTYDSFSESSAKPKQKEFDIEDSEAKDIIDRVKAGKIPETSVDDD